MKTEDYQPIRMCSLDDLPASTHGAFKGPRPDLVRLTTDPTATLQRSPQHPLATVTDLLMVKADGHEVWIRLTNSSSHVDLEDSYPRWMMGTKARQLGWLPSDSCPLWLVHVGWLNPSRVIAKKILDEQHCGRQRLTAPCAHYVAEREARREVTAKREAEERAVYERANPTLDDKIAAVMAKSHEQLAAAIAGTKGKSR